jgi:hypothetical protein
VHHLSLNNEIVPRIRLRVMRVKTSRTRLRFANMNKP